MTSRRVTWNWCEIRIFFFFGYIIQESDCGRKVESTSRLSAAARLQCLHAGVPRRRLVRVRQMVFSDGERTACAPCVRSLRCLRVLRLCAAGRCPCRATLLRLITGLSASVSTSDVLNSAGHTSGRQAVLTVQCVHFWRRPRHWRSPVCKLVSHSGHCQAPWLCKVVAN